MEAIPNQVPAVQDDTLKELLRYEKKNLRINRIKLICALLCVVICVIVAVLLAVHVGRITKEVESVSEIVIETGENMNQVAKDLNKLDFEALGDSVQTFAVVGTETIEQIKEATNGLDEIMDQVRIAVTNLSDINIDELNEGIKTLHEVLQPLANFFGLFR